MLRGIKDLWKLRSRASQTRPVSPLSNLSPDQRVDTTILLLEIVRSDLRVIDTELQVVKEAIRNTFGLSEGETAELIKQSEEARRHRQAVESLSHPMNATLSVEQKKDLVKLLWRVALSDARLERDEDYMVRRIARMLNLHHLDIVDAKLKAEEKDRFRHRDA